MTTALRRSVAAQRAFFERHIASWIFSCCAAIRESTIANYYACVAEFTEQYVALDRGALAMEKNITRSEPVLEGS